MKFTAKAIAPLLATAALLVGIRCLAYQRIARDGADAFFAKSKAGMDAIPAQLGDWRGERKDLDAGTLDLLRPNAFASIVFKNEKAGRAAQLLVVQTRDARDLCGHAPVICYPAAGYAIDRTESRTIRLGTMADGVSLKPAVYHLSGQTAAGAVRTVVYSVFVFPDGTTGQTLADVNKVAADYRKLAYGAAHVQVLAPADRLTDADRDAIFASLVGAPETLALIRTLRTGIPHP